ncbi:MAG: subtilisin-like proprotein convertase family protein, partial [Chitinophagales bacterium]
MLLAIFDFQNQVSTMKYFILSCLFFFTIVLSYSQENFWSERNFQELNLQGQQFIFPEKYLAFELEYQSIKSYIFNAPLENQIGSILNSPIQISVPMPTGEFEHFNLVESPVYDLELIEKFPGIKTFVAYNSEHPNWYARFDLTPQGFHGMILGTDKGTVFIDPIMHLGDLNHYFSYYKKDFHRENEALICHLDDKLPSLPSTSNSNGTHKSFGSCELRTYRLAVSATGEYTTFHGGTVAQALAAQVTTMNRVNGIFERDIAIHMNIIANNNLIIYTNAATDPFSNGNTNAMINENQTNTDAVIGSANYDIGHIFGTNSGGLAQLFSPCSGNKARGVTGSGAPVGDPFDIDYVAHEMGHQFGANHTQNNSCNRNNATAMEPGSASTIMGYAGICAPNVQSNSDDYFHGISLEEMGSFILGSGNLCPVKTPLGNLAPSVSVPFTTVSIPANTPFSLTAFATDPNAANTLTYCWEQMDNASATMPPVSTNTDGPAFRSFDPSTNPTRYFPRLPDVIAGVTPTWEVLPSVTRSMDFRVLVRDNNPGGGCNDHEDITVNVVGSAGPFVVNYPSATGITWTGNSNDTVTWNVANTDASPISCANVNILISYDGGVSFPDTLANNVTNDGSQLISVPNISTTDALVIVQCANGTFYDVSDNTFTITALVNDFTFTSSNSNISLCPGDDAIYNLTVGFLGVITDTVTLSTTGLPAGLSFNFSNNSQAPAYGSIFTISNTNAVTPGLYNFSLLASTSTFGTKTINASIEIFPNLSGTINALTPANTATGISSPINITWSTITDFSYYDIVLSTHSGLSTTLESEDSLTTESYTSGTLPPNTTIYWQVEAWNECDTVTSNIFSFTTINCVIYSSTDIPVSISGSGTPTITSNIFISGALGIINDINVINLTGDHTYISDLIFTLSSPSATSVILLDKICNNQNDFDINFDDAAANNNYPCPPTDGGFYIPEESLAAFNSEDANGTWVLTVEDRFNQDGGSLDSWGLEICFDAPCTASTTPTIAPVPGVYCPNTTVNLIASGGVSEPGATINWYTGPNGTGTSLGTGSIVSVTADSTQTFYARREGPCNTTNDYSVTVNVRPFIYALDGTTSNTYCTDNSGWNHFFNASNEIIFSMQGDLSGAGPGFPLVTISDNGVYYEENQGPNSPGDCANSLNPGEHRFEMERSWDVNFGGGAPSPPYSVRFYHTPAERTAIESAAANFISTFPACAYTYKYANPLGFYWFKNLGSNYTAPDYDGMQLSGANGTTANSVNYAELTGITSFSGGSGAIILGPSTSLYEGILIDSISTCDSLTWIDGNTYSASNSTATFEIASGDTLVTLDLTINNSSAGTDTQTACDSLTWIDSNTYTANNSSATFNILAGAANGCDSLVTLNLTINNSSTGTDTRTECNSLTWIDGNTYTANNSSATFNILAGAANGCDSLVTLNLTINNASTGTDTRTECDSLTWIDGNTYTTNNNSATFNIVSGTANGCDSLVTLNLTINNSSAPTIINATSCNASAVGSVIDTFMNTAGCDSMVTTNTSLLAGSTGSESITACDSTQIGSTWYFNSTIFNDTLIAGASNGCDSMVTYNVFINNSVATNETLIACDSAQVNGTWFFGSQNVVDNFTTGAACDSIHTVLLTINNSVSTNANLAACDSAQVNGTWYFSTQAVPNTFPANNTCDSTHIVNLTINNSSAPTIINATSCNASAVGSVIDTFMNTAGCDSMVTT